MKWSPQQDEALIAVAKWIKDPFGPQVFRLFGHAGTGKSTLAQHLAESVEGNVVYGAYTGKAAYVMRQNGCLGATTIHAHIYHSRDHSKLKLKELEAGYAELFAELKAEAAPDEDISEHRRLKDIRQLIEDERKMMTRPVFTLNPESAVRDAELVVIDECSMVDGRMGDDLCSFQKKILVLGDPAQLPPVMGGGFFTANCEPDIMLTEIHRQARDNPIIAMATLVREGNTLDLGSYGESSVRKGEDIGPEDAMEADQILVGKNVTRFASNRRARALLGYEDPLPIEGDRLVCLRNNHEVGLLNGAIWNVSEQGIYEGDRIWMSIRPEHDVENIGMIDVEAHTHYFLGQEKKLAWWERKEAQEFDYGYALTVHKAQGSQWDNVLLFDESWCFRADRYRWLYTGLTRGAKKVTVIRL